jgi:hypothetical protein
VDTFRSAGEGRWLSYGLALLAQIHTAQERAAEARVLLEEALGVWSQVKMTYGQPFDAYLRYYLGNAVLAQGDADSANAQFEASLREFRAAGDDLPAAWCSAASDCSPHSEANTTRPGPGSLKACPCCAAAKTSGT